MTLTTRTALALALSLMLPFAERALAQAPATTSTETAQVETADSATTTDTSASETPSEGAETTTATEAETRDPYAIRSELNAVVRNLHRDVSHVLIIQPELLTNESFLAEYPVLARFVAANPEVAENPRFYMSEWRDPRVHDDDFSDVMEGFAIIATFGLIAVALGWIIRTIIEQKRWNRLARTQNEVHNKILDRFGSSEELIEYMKSPAGAKYLEAAPITVSTAPAQPQNGSIGRLMLSIQAGVVVVAAGLGMMLVSIPLKGSGAVNMFSLGAIAFCIGAGFIASAAVSLTMSRRLGIWRDETSNNQLPNTEHLR